jgi:Sulfotransferase family
VTIRRLFARASESEPALIPIVVETSGRDGSTLMMQLLGTSSAIAFDRIYPFEQRYLSYLLALSRVVELDEWDERAWNINELAFADRVSQSGLVGPVPWTDRNLLTGESGQPPPLGQRIFGLLWEEFSRRARMTMRTRYDDQALQVTYYAEKITAGWRLDWDYLPQMKLLPLLRDPRDTWLSTVAFNERITASGARFMTFRAGETESEYLRRFIGDQKARMQWLLSLGESAPITRYEELVADPEAEAERLSARLDVQLTPMSMDESSVLAWHMTASSPAGSVGRWKQEMSDEVAAMFAAEMATELRAHGYEA